MGLDHDQILLQILCEEKNISNLLDIFFGFLHRCTDFYIESNEEHKLGFPPGIAEKLVLSSMYKWKNAATTLKKISSPINQNESCVLENENRCIPAVAQEIEIGSCNESDTINVFSELPFKADHTSDSYNGATRENYVWSQTVNDLNVIIKIPEHVKLSKDVKVEINSDEIKIEAKSAKSTEAFDWQNIFYGKLSFKIRKNESIWNIISGKHISIHLEKASERWWEALLVGEPKIQLSKIDCSQNFNDMAPAEQMKLQELIWNHQQKLLGKPTSEEIKMEGILKQAWNAKGSPFQGTPYDPSILKND